MNKISLFVTLLLIFGFVGAAIPDGCYTSVPDYKLVCTNLSDGNQLCAEEIVDYHFEIDPSIVPKIHTVRIDPTTVNVSDNVRVVVAVNDTYGIDGVTVKIGKGSKALSFAYGFDNGNGVWAEDINAPDSNGEYHVEVTATNLCGNTATDDSKTLNVVGGSSGDGNDNEHFDVDVSAGCANEDANVTVLRRGTERGVSSANVVLNYNGSKMDSAKTDDDGNAVVTPKYKGSYELVVSHSGYDTKTKTFSVSCVHEENEGSETVETYYNVSWLPVEDQSFYAGAKSVVEVKLQNTGNGEAKGVALDVVNCPAGWECGIAPSTTVAIGSDKTLTAYAWFVVPENEAKGEKVIMLSSKIGDESDKATFKAEIKPKETSNMSAEEADALAAINKMSGDIENAKKEGLNVTNATSLLADAQEAYINGNYGGAQSYSTLILAQLADEKGASTLGQLGEGNGNFVIDANMLGMVAVVVVALLILALVTVYFTSGRTKQATEGTNSEEGGAGEAAANAKTEITEAETNAASEEPLVKRGRKRK